MLDALLVKLDCAEVLKTDREFDLATAYLASALRTEGFSVEIIDGSLEELTIAELRKRILARPARVIGLSVWLHRLVRDAEELVQELRHAGIASHITMGSHSPTFLYEDLLRNNTGLDSVVCGEGEWTLVDMVRAICDGREAWREVPGVASLLEGQVIYTPRPATCELDSLPMPALDYLDMTRERGQIMSLLSSRGCYGRCTFCSTGPFYRLAGGKPWRAHSAERVLAELGRLHFDHGIRYFGFRDDNFIGPGAIGQERARKIAAGIQVAGMEIKFYLACRVNDINEETFFMLREAGLTRVFLGVESGSQKRLDAFRKGVTVNDNHRAIKVLYDLKIPVTVGYIMFSPDTTWQEYRESRKFLDQALGSLTAITDSVHDLFNTLEVYPGTELAEQLRGVGGLIGDYHEYGYAFKDRRVRFLVNSIQGLRRAAKGLGRRLNEERYQERSKAFKGEERK
jgi:radical SAM superfamily enzyme YgiQ (UPF0313 family)